MDKTLERERLHDDGAALTHERRNLSLWLTFASFVGLLASSKLVLEKLSFLQQKADGTSPLLGCDLNPIVGCGPVINTAQASIFGSVPNPLIGVVAFSALLMFAVLLLSRVAMPKWVWAGVQAGVVFGLGIVTYLQYESIYSLHALCPYCMVVWAVMIPTFWLVTARNLRVWAPHHKAASFVFNWTTLLISLHFLILLGLIWLQFGTTLWA